MSKQQIDRALSIAEPWAWAVVSGAKALENRTWPTDYRGPIAIHSSTATRHFTPEAAEYLTDCHPAIAAALDDERIDDDHPLFYFGCIVGIAEIVDCIRYDPTTDDPDDVFAKLGGDGQNALGIPHGYFADGPCCFVLANARRFRHPIPAAGKLNLWRLSAEQMAAVEAAAADCIDDPGEPAVQPEGWRGGVKIKEKKAKAAGGGKAKRQPEAARR